MYSKIIGTGGYLPKKILTNKDLESIVDTTDEWILERTGIKQRHIAEENETTSSMATQASLDAINSACLLYTSPSPRDVEESRMPSSA